MRRGLAMDDEQAKALDQVPSANQLAFRVGTASAVFYVAGWLVPLDGSPPLWHWRALLGLVSMFGWGTSAGGLFGMLWHRFGLERFMARLGAGTLTGLALGTGMCLSAVLGGWTEFKHPLVWAVVAGFFTFGGAVVGATSGFFLLPPRRPPRRRPANRLL